MVSLRAVHCQNQLGAGLNDGWTVGAAPLVAMVAHVEVFIRAAAPG